MWVFVKNLYISGNKFTVFPLQPSNVLGHDDLQYRAILAHQPLALNATLYTPLMAFTSRTLIANKAKPQSTELHHNCFWREDSLQFSKQES